MNKYLLVLLLLVSTSALATDVEFTNGTAGGEDVSLTTIDTGDVEFTSGSIGDREVNTTTIEVGNIRFTSGTVDGESINTTTISTRDDDD